MFLPTYVLQYGEVGVIFDVQGSQNRDPSQDLEVKTMTATQIVKFFQKLNHFSLNDIVG